MKGKFLFFTSRFRVLIERSSFLVIVLFPLLSMGDIFSLHAQTTELFLPFPETWNNDNSNSKFQPSTSTEINSKTPSSAVAADNQISVTTKSKPVEKKKKKKEVIDPSLASFQKGKAYLTRDQKKSAESEFADSYGKEGDVAKFSRVENTNLFGLDGNDKDSTALVEKQEDPDLKIKTQFELARSLDRIGNTESEEKAYKEYLKLVTEYPKHPELTPRSHYAMAILLIRKKEFRSAAHQLVNIIKNFKESAEYLPAHYYLGKIYESSWDERDLERSLKYYQLYMNGVEGKTTVPGYDFKKETRERMRVLGSSI
ncbi:tetratricopeptide repeat protein [Leptospira sp. 2 VSF19]|uniref:Tetratricopeptide repeat protein n=1 Tax=Leptospira soteropolitanensis TaxID=2950025 RepID=A0AAW5VLM0_9LEPT|nr:tetratricopeptide repeat protein [Leptospira soteropolitanensis]MCW7493445.1 tetratricopeptide repeat protein [Leptospira soteropolitanensis]MCW7501023.1 tetratricopeptide repeat protein [Leptospira soteropolitanensis]MCW7523297.1 tetratricopeptide repeat protein [Leptospira soteropolitanensis]MCW7527158.1 tetratricopeptide repeat protein [Leptospira soteropolitanensis]MCW7531015.1 tetratricopeptide repeat protein [Leptospira soteropolitanensis]